MKNLVFFCYTYVSNGEAHESVERLVKLAVRPQKFAYPQSFKAFFRRSTEFRWPEFVELRTKVHLLDEGYAWVPKTKDFTKDPRKEISGN